MSELTEKQLSLLREFAEEMKNIEYWIGGGYGVDGIAGRITREHGDIDIIIPIEMTPQITDFFQRRLYDVSEKHKNLQAKKGDVKVDIVRLETEGGCYMFSTERFFKNIKIPKNLYGTRKCRIGDVEYNSLDSTLLLASKLININQAREADKEDVKLLEPFSDKKKLKELFRIIGADGRI